MSFLDDALDVISPIANIAAGVTKSMCPAVSAIAAGIEVIDAICDDDDDDNRTLLYKNLANSLSLVCAEIIRALDDGVINAEEHTAIKSKLQGILVEL